MNLNVTVIPSPEIFGLLANYSPELEELRKNKSTYFTKAPLAKGVLEGIQFHISAMGISL